MDLDEAIQAAGPFGRFQWRAVALGSCGWALSAAIQLVTPFTTKPPEWRYIDSFESLPSQPADSCMDVFTTNRSWEWVDAAHSVNSDLISISELDGPCDAGKYQGATASSAFFFGALVGTPLLSSLADWRGRKIVFFSTLLVECIAAGFAAVSSTFTFYTICRFLAGLSGAGMGLMAFVYPAELVGKDYRARVMQITSIAFGVGVILVALVASLIRDWRVLTIVTTMPGVFFFFGPCTYFPESPAFLLAQGRTANAQEVLRFIARANGNSEANIELCSEDVGDGVAPQKETQETCCDLMRLMPKRLSIMSACWVAVSMGYYGISLGVGDLGPDIYVTSVLMGLVEVPAYPLCAWLVSVRALGRRWSLFVSMVLASWSCVCAAFLLGLPRIVVALIGKLSVAGAYAIVVLFGTELFPASTRSLAMGVQSTSARVAAVFAPFVLATQHPMLIFGLVAACVVPFILLLPETLGKTIPTKLSDAGGADILRCAELLGYSSLRDEGEITAAPCDPNANAIGVKSSDPRSL